MTSEFLRQERTALSDVPLGHLEYDYIGKCRDGKELEKIIKVLRSGEEGRYPDIETFAEKRLAEINPKSRLLRKEQRVSTSADLDKSEWEAITGDLSNWTDEMKSAEGKMKAPGKDMDENDSSLPPVRGQKTITSMATSLPKQGASKNKKEKPDINKRVKPREYREWDKIDVDAELEKIDKDDGPESEEQPAPKVQNVLSKPSVPTIPSVIDATGMSKEDMDLKAEQEKNKGNEAFRANDFQEALLYYNRSLSLIPSVAVHNNRAQTYIKLSKWDKALEDCQTVLSREPKNLKGLLRRAVTYQGKKQYVNSEKDVRRVLDSEPGNKRAKALLKEVQEALEEQKTKGRRMVIEETDGSSDEDEEQEAPPKPPMVNGDEKADEALSTNAQRSSSTEKTEDISPQKPEPETQAAAMEKVTKAANVVNEPVAPTEHKKSEKDPVEAPAETKQSEKKQVATGTSKVQQKQQQKPEQSSGNTNKKNKRKKRKSNMSQSDSASEDQHPKSEAPAAVEKESKTESEAPIPEVQSKDKDSGSDVQGTTSLPPESAVKSHEEDAKPVKVVEEPPPEPAAPLPQAVSALKAKGNDFFKVGQFGEAIAQYTKAMDQLAKAKGNHTVNLHLLYSNRGLCKLKIGDCEGCVRDSNAALELQPGSVKPLARRGQAYESMEKFRRAYIDYRQVLYVDSSVEVAHQGLNRCMKMLQQMDGPKWREKLPNVSVTHLTQTPQTSTQTQAPADKNIPSSESTTKSKETPEPQVPETTKEQLFDKHKAEGNSYFQKGDFTSAVACYSLCVEICPEKSVAYVNRAFSYLRLNQPEKAITDCNKGLELEAKNIKALFRRALGYKALENYDESYRDLTSLLKMDPKNPSARKELLSVMTLRDKAMKEKAAQKQKEEKARHRMNIQEVSDSDSSDEEIPPPPPPPQKAKPTVTSPPKTMTSPKAKEEKTEPKSMVEPLKDNKEASKKIEEIPETKPVEQKKPEETKAPAPKSSSTPVEKKSKGAKSHPKVTLTKATAYEFVKAWTGLRGIKEVGPYADLLDQMDPEDLPKVISNKLDGDMLHMLIQCVEVFIDKGQLSRSLAYLQNLINVPRFNMVTMFMGSKEKLDLERVFGKLSEGATCPLLQEDLKKLREAYEM